MSQHVLVEFGGGLELLFGGSKRLSIELPEAGLNVGGLIRVLATAHLRERLELFVAPGSENSNVRPGILVLINDADWELEGAQEYQLQPGDAVLFISTLHGG